MRLPAAAFAALVVAAASPARAGAPFVIDDPQPTGVGRWEIYAFVGGARPDGGASGEAGLDMSYGAAEDLQLSLVIPAAFDDTGGPRAGMGTVEAGAKYKVLHQRAGSWAPDVAVFPRLFLPTAGHRFGSDRLSVLLPIWVGKYAGPWSVFGGGGYQLNPGPGNRDFWLTGLGATRKLTGRLTVGAELYRRTRSRADGRDFTAANIGALYRLSGPWSLVAAAGPGLENPGEEGRYTFYLAIKADY
jgi:hypothetical protein